MKRLACSFRFRGRKAVVLCGLCGVAAIALLFGASVAFSSFPGTCADYPGNAGYVLYPNHERSFLDDWCDLRPGSTCYECSVPESEPGEPMGEWVHCAEDQAGAFGRCERYDSWWDLQQDLNSRVRHQYPGG